MNLPPFVYSLAFWKAASYTAAGVLLLLYYFNVIPETWVFDAGAILMAVLAVLNFFGVVPELRSKGLIK